MKPNEIKTFIDYSYWAFDRVWDCVMQLTDEQFAQPIDYSTGSIREYIVHLTSAIHRRIQQLQGKAVPAHFSSSDFPSRQSVKTKWDEIKMEVYEYLSALTEFDLNDKMSGTLPEGTVLEYRRWVILLHVVNHATDHRAQVLAMLHYHFGVNTVGQDMMAFLTEQNQ